MPTLREAEASGNTSDLNVDQQLLSKSAGGDNPPNTPLPFVTLPDDSHAEARPDGSVVED